MAPSRAARPCAPIRLTDSPRPRTFTAASVFAWAWLAVFLFEALTRSTVRPPHPAVLPMLALTGLAYAWTIERAAFSALLRRHAAIWWTLALFIGMVAVAEVLAHARDVPGLAPFLPAPCWLVLCLPGLAVIVSDGPRLRFAVLLFAALSIWHFFATPFEAVTGMRLSWQPMELFPRDAGPLHYQASGLAWQVYYFTGLFLPLFYLAWGPISEGRIVSRPQLSVRDWGFVAMAWGLPAVCSQSRSAFAGTLAAGLLALAAWKRPTRLSTWLALGMLVIVGGAGYAYLFSANKSGLGLRLAYYELYFAESMKWPAVLVGHGFTLVPNEAMFVKGLTPLEHAHNDVIQTLFSWGAVALAAYVAFFISLLRLVWRDYLSRGRYWPACALLVFIPSTVTDLGFQHFEKAAFLVLFTCWCMVFASREARLTAGAGTRVPESPLAPKGNLQ